jgi:hypothetical protein
MAPTSNSPKAMQHTRSRPSVPKAIVPAIPLPYIQKRKQQVAARQNAKEREKEDAQPAPATEPQSPPAPPPAVVEPAVANGSFVEHGDSEPKEASEETSNTPEPVLPVVYSNGAELQEPANQEPAAQAHQDIPGKPNSLYLQNAYGLIYLRQTKL